MPRKQRITLSVFEELLKRLEELSSKRRSTIAETARELLRQEIERQDRYEAAKQRHAALLEKGFDLGTDGSIEFNREKLHVRP